MGNKKNNKNIEEDAILNSLGLLDNNEQELFDEKLNMATEEEKKTVSEYNNIISLLPLMMYNSDMELFPSKKVKENLMNRISSGKSAMSKSKSFSFVFDKENDWVQHPLQGIKVKQLSQDVNKGYTILLMKVAAGVQYPPHHHTGAEECYVIEGDLHAEGKSLGPGDFHHADGGTDHNPLFTIGGCTVLLVVDSADY